MFTSRYCFYTYLQNGTQEASNNDSNFNIKNPSKLGPEMGIAY